MNSLIAATNPILKPNSAWICHTQLKLWPFCDIFAYFGQNLAAMETSLRPLQSEMSSLEWLTTKTPVISNHVLAISCRNAFICIYSNFSPKIGCHGNAALSLVYGTQTNSLMVQLYLKTKLCMDMLHTTEVMAIFVIFLPILTKIWLPWQRPLDRCNQKCLLWIVQPRKPPAVSTRILVISYKCIHMYL